MTSAPRDNESPRRLVATGALVGMTWAAALRGWMVQMAGSDSHVHWSGTFVLVLAPGLAVGALFGFAEHRRRIGGHPSRWLTLAPCLLLAALLDPTIFHQLVTEGIGGGSIGVVTIGLAGGQALSGRGRVWWRVACGVLAVLGVLLMSLVASDTAPLQTARGAWVGLYASSLVAVLCLACAIPRRIGGPVLIPHAWIAATAGALCGIAWASALRAFMWEVAGSGARVEWAGTFLWVLLPGAVIGALLGWCEYQRWSGPVPHRRWLVWSPMLFAAALVHDPSDLIGGFAGGIGLAAIAVPAMCMVGGYAIAGRGRLAVRAVCGLIALSAVPIWSLTATDVGGPSLSLGNPHGAWAASLYWGLLATFSMAAAVPHRAASQRPPTSSPGEPTDHGSTCRRCLETSLS